MLDEERRVVVVVGGSGGIGAATAERLIRQDCRVILTARDTARLEAVAARLGAIAHPLDARDGEAVEALFARLAGDYGRVDGAVNCAGSILLKPAHLTTDQEFSDTIAANLVTAFNVLRAAVRVMMRSAGGGSIVLCSSVAARRGLMNHEAVAAAKAGVEGLVLAAAATYARRGIRINGVAPGLTRTELTRSITGSEQAERASAALHPLGRIGEPREVASAIDWLLNPEQSWVTAQVLGVDGGLSHAQARPGS